MKFPDIINLALRKSFFFPSAEIYNSPSGFWDYANEGTLIANNIVSFWRKFVQSQGFIEIKGSTILPEEVFQASGHLKNFKDPIVQCTKCHTWYRADHLISEKTKKEVPENLPLEDYDKQIQDLNIQCTKCKSSLSQAKYFNMMMGVKIGATLSQQSYLRPETCQNIFLDFARIYKSSRKTLPLGIAQVGHSFRNEVAPRNSLLRAREFTQMEIEIFFNPSQEFKTNLEEKTLNLWIDNKIQKTSIKTALSKNLISHPLVAHYLFLIQDFYFQCGIPEQNLRLRKLSEQEKAFYAKEAFDLEILVNNQWIEMVACNNRSSHDLGEHSKHSKKDLSIDNEIPNVFELSAGLDRLIFVLLALSYKERDNRQILSLPPKISPYLCSIFPLLKNNPDLVEKSQFLFSDLTKEFSVLYDEKSSIGRRYSRADEIGIPFALTIDHQTLEDNTITIRDRDSLEQKRISLSQAREILRKLYFSETQFSQL